MFRLLRLSALPCCDLCSSTSLLSFAKVRVVLILSYSITTCVFRRYDQTSVLVILLEDLFDQSFSSADLPNSDASLCFTTVNCHAIATELLLNNVGSKL